MYVFAIFKATNYEPDLDGGTSRPALARRYLVRPRTSVGGGGIAPPCKQEEEEEGEGGSHREDSADSAQGWSKRSTLGCVIPHTGNPLTAGTMSRNQESIFLKIPVGGGGGRRRRGGNRKSRVAVFVSAAVVIVDDGTVSSHCSRFCHMVRHGSRRHATGPGATAGQPD